MAVPLPIGIGTNGGEALGPLLAALLVPILDTRGVLLLDAATFLASAALLTFLPSLKRDSPTGTMRGTFLDDTLAGLQQFRGDH